MRLSTKGRYAIRAMLDLALQEEERPVMIKDICRRQDISNLYLEQLLNRLKTAGLVRSTRGPRGGFSLNRQPNLIKISDILQAMEGSTAPTDCVDNADLCPRAACCVTRNIWLAIKEATDGVLEATTLNDLINQEKSNNMAKQTNEPMVEGNEEPSTR